MPQRRDFLFAARMPYEFSHCIRSKKSVRSSPRGLNRKAFYLVLSKDPTDSLGSAGGKADVKRARSVSDRRWSECYDDAGATCACGGAASHGCVSSHGLKCR